MPTDNFLNKYFRNHNIDFTISNFLSDDENDVRKIITFQKEPKLHEIYIETMHRIHWLNDLGHMPLVHSQEI